MSPFPAYCVQAPHNHPNVEKSCNLIRLWPEVFNQFQTIIDSVGIFIDESNNSSIRYRSHHIFGHKIAATINKHIGFAEALVHEMAHHKLFALGVQIELAERIIRNPPEQKFKSPIRYDCLRPMSAIFHAQYPFTYVAALLIKIIKANSICESDRDVAGMALAQDLPKLEFGHKIIMQNVDFDNEGAAFWEGYLDWFNRILNDGFTDPATGTLRRQPLSHPPPKPFHRDGTLDLYVRISKILQELQIPLKPFVHPIDGQATYKTAEKMAVRQYIEDPNEVPSIGFDAQVSEDSIDMANTRPCRVSGIQKHSLFDEMVLYFPARDFGISLNSSATMVWELCDGQHTLVEIGQAIGQRLGIRSSHLLSELLSDVKVTIMQFQNLGLLYFKN